MEILLKNATRDELIEELKKRESITYIQVLENEGSNVISKECKMAVDGPAHIFVIKGNEKDCLEETVKQSIYLKHFKTSFVVCDFNSDNIRIVKDDTATICAS